MTIAYQGPLLDYSGYGEANRHFVAALEAAGVDVAGQLVSYAKDRADYGTLGPVVTKALENRRHYKIKILHTTPDEIPRLKEAGKYNIAHFFWETDKIPEVFVKGLREVDEIWTGSQANHNSIRKAGLTDIPIMIIPQPIETDRDWPEPYELPDFPVENKTLFYSIFEWTDRKNPEALIRAYFNEFTAADNVGLLIKTYHRNFNLSNKRMIKNAIHKIKAEFGEHDKLPPIFVYFDLMDRQQIMRLHRTGNIYVSAHHGEGWGVPQAEAILAGNLVISTGYGGIHEYLANNKNAILLPYKMQPLRGMANSPEFYHSDQLWADINPEDLQRAMRWAQSNPASADLIAKAGTEFLLDNFNLKRVGGLMADRLKNIEEELI